MNTDGSFLAGEGSGPLAGIRVIDLSSVVMGPYATQILGDLGADVISVEDAKGDTNRIMGPGPHPQLSDVSLNLLRNKRNVTLDLKTVEGRAQYLALVETADIVVTNLRPGPLKRLRLTYDDLVAVRPNIIYCEARGFAEGSPRAEDPAYDDIVQAAAGIADLMQRTEGRPRITPTIVADKICGLTIAYSVLAALYHRQVTGEGQRLEVPMVDTMQAFILVEHSAGAMSPQSDGQYGTAGYPRILTPKRGPLATSDGWVSLLPYSNEHWRSIVSFGGRPELADDPRFLTPRARIRNADDMYTFLGEILRHKTTDEWVAFCDAAKVPCSKVVSVQDMARELPIAEHPKIGTYRVVPPAVRFSKTPQKLRRHAPLIGEHNDELLGDPSTTR
jgi:crotonobetainyl-CoA:carnitine CoA-transferase CaiB-like acyl-CoA transferase